MEIVQYELIRYDPEGLGRTQPCNERHYYVARFTHNEVGMYRYKVIDPETTFTYAQRTSLLKAKKKREQEFAQEVRILPDYFSVTEKKSLIRLRKSLQNDGIDLFLDDFVPNRSIISVLNELDL